MKKRKRPSWLLGLAVALLLGNLLNITPLGEETGWDGTKPMMVEKQMYND